MSETEASRDGPGQCMDENTENVPQLLTDQEAVAEAGHIEEAPATPVNVKNEKKEKKSQKKKAPGITPAKGGNNF